MENKKRKKRKTETKQIKNKNKHEFRNSFNQFQCKFERIAIFQSIYRFFLTYSEVCVFTYFIEPKRAIYNVRMSEHSVVLLPSLLNETDKSFISSVKISKFRFLEFYLNSCETKSFKWKASLAKIYCYFSLKVFVWWMYL